MDMEGTCVRTGEWYRGDMGLEGTWVWRGHGYGRRDMIMEGTRVCRGQGYGRDMGMEGT